MFPQRSHRADVVEWIDCGFHTLWLVRLSVLRSRHFMYLQTRELDVMALAKSRQPVMWTLPIGELSRTDSSS